MKRSHLFVLIAIMLMAAIPLLSNDSAAVHASVSKVKSVRTSAPKKSNKWFYSNKNWYYANGWQAGPSGGNCTWYAFGRAAEYTGKVQKLSKNNACTWYKSWGGKKGKTPKPGSIICWSYAGGGDGHVAFVEKVSSKGNIFISNSGWSRIPSWNNGGKYHSTRSGNISYGWIKKGSHKYRAWPGLVFQGFIYLKGNSVSTYSVKYDANGGTGAPSAQTKTKGKALTLSNAKPKKEGYTFRGWSIAKDNSVEYSPGSTYKADKAVTLYALWKANNHTFSFDCGGIGNKTVCSGGNLTIPNTVPTKDGYKFKCWNVKRNNKEWYVAEKGWISDASISNYAKRQYHPGDFYNIEWHWLKNTYGNNSYKFYAQWEKTGSDEVEATLDNPIQTIYYVTYNANGGSGAPAEQSKVNDSVLKLSTVKPTRSGYAFQGWATSSGSTTVAYKSGASYSATKSITLYAVWKVSHTFSFGLNDGSGSFSDMKVVDGQEFSIPSKKPSRKGYTFKGWYVKRTTDNVWYYNSSHGWMNWDKAKKAGYTPKMYDAGRTMKFDSTWTKGCAKGNYRFYAQWKKN